MPEKKSDKKKRNDKEPATESSRTGSRKSLLLKSLFLILVPAVAIGAAYQAGLLEPAIRWANTFRATGEQRAVLTGMPVETLISSREVLSVVGKSPIDPSQVLFPSFDTPDTGKLSDGPKSCPPDILGVQAQEGEVTGKRVVRTGSVEIVEGTATSSEPKAPDSPAIVTRKPSDKASSADSKHSARAPEAILEKAHGADAKKRNRSDGAGSRKTQQTNKGSGHPPKASDASLATDSKKGESASGRRETSKRGGQKGRAGAAPSESDKEERFQLPGSLLVKIKGYEGSLIKWGIMVILDDSRAMARKTRTWSAGRSQAATALVEKLPGIVTPGTKIAVRDFLCRKSARKRKRGVCLSHLLFDWSGSPFKELKETLARSDPAGRNNPCAAARYAVKRDLSGLGELAPRVLVVTAGVTKCAASNVVRAINKYRGGEKVAVDVVGLGMRRQTRRGYIRLAKKTGGLFLTVDSPAKVDRALARYRKTLRKRAMEKVEVRGDNVVFTVNPGEEITLAPGSYSVILPLVGRLKASRRTISNVKINSGETKVLKVKIRKGRPVVRFARN